MSNHAQKLAKLKQKLAEYEAKRDEIITTGQSIRLRNGDDNRELTNVSLAQLNALIENTERQIDQLEAYLNSQGNPSGIRVSARVL